MDVCKEDGGKERMKPINWIFNRKEMMRDNLFRRGVRDVEKYNYRKGGKDSFVIHGMANPKKRSIFINLYNKPRPENTVKYITHETLHVAGNIGGSHGEEKTIKRLMRRV